MKALLCGLVAVAACSDSPTHVPTCQVEGGSACFQLPTDIIQTRDGAPSNLGCSDFMPTPSVNAVSVSGLLQKYGVSVPVAGATITFYATPEFSPAVATATTAADGTWSLVLPAGTPNIVYTQSSASGFVDSRGYFIGLDLTKPSVTNFNGRIVTSDNVESAALLVKENWDPTKSIYVGTALDCMNMIVEHAIATVSSEPGVRKFVDGVAVYYSAPGAVPLAVLPEDRGDTNDNGAFAFFHMPPDVTLYGQLWGYIDAAAMAQGADGLTMLAEFPVTSPANTATSLNAYTLKP